MVVRWVGLWVGKGLTDANDEEGHAVNGHAILVGIIPVGDKGRRAGFVEGEDGERFVKNVIVNVGD
jgi:hypothetical protein